MSLVQYTPTPTPAWPVAPVSRTSQRWLNQIDQSAVVERRRVEVAASIVRTELAETYDLAKYTVFRAADLHDYITDRCHGNAGLEMALRSFEAMVLAVSAERVERFAR